MNMNNCPRCKLSFKTNHRLNQHLNRKYPCLDTKIKQNEYLYVIHTGDCIVQNIPIYKVGRSCQTVSSDGITKRLQGYPKGSVQKGLWTVTNCVSAEYHMKELLVSSKDLKHRRDHGMEYFEGSLYNILILVAATVAKFDSTYVENINTTDIAKNINITDIAKNQCLYCMKLFSRYYEQLLQ